MATKYHKITGNETIGSIAGIYGTDPQTLLKANPNMLSAVSGAFLKIPGTPPPPTGESFWKKIGNLLTGNTPIQPGSTEMAGVGGSLAGIPLQGSAQDYARLNTGTTPFTQIPRGTITGQEQMAVGGSLAGIPLQGMTQQQYANLNTGGPGQPITPYPINTLQTYPLQNQFSQNPSLQTYPLQNQFSTQSRILSGSFLSGAGAPNTGQQPILTGGSLSGDKQGVVPPATQAAVTAASRAQGRAQFMSGNGTSGGYIPTRSDVWNMKANKRRKQASKSWGDDIDTSGGRSVAPAVVEPVAGSNQSNIGNAASVWRIG